MRSRHARKQTALQKIVDNSSDKSGIRIKLAMRVETLERLQIGVHTFLDSFHLICLMVFRVITYPT